MTEGDLICTDHYNHWLYLAVVRVLVVLVVLLLLSWISHTLCSDLTMLLLEHLLLLSSLGSLLSLPPAAPWLLQGPQGGEVSTAVLQHYRDQS